MRSVLRLQPVCIAWSFDHGEHTFGLDLEHASGGNCACTTCHVVVKKGRNCSTKMDDKVADRLDMGADLQLNSRLGCQTVIQKPEDVVIEIPTWKRNYVSEGGD